MNRPTSSPTSSPSDSRRRKASRTGIRLTPISVASSPWEMCLPPAGTPPEILDKLNTAIQAALQTKEVRAQYETLGVDVAQPLPRADAAKVIAAEYDTLSKLIVSANIKPQQ